MDDQKPLIESLMKNPRLSVHDTKTATEAERLVNSLIDISEIIPKIEVIAKKLLAEGLTLADQDDLLFDLRLEMGHLTYHIHDSVFLREIYDESAESYVPPK